MERVHSPGKAPAATQTSQRRRSPVRRAPATELGADATSVEAAIAEPAHAKPEAVLQLQRLSGNRAVRDLLARQRIQAQLTVGAAGDTYEQEADRIAAEVAHGPAMGQDAGDRGGAGASTAVTATITPVAQRHTPDPKPGSEPGDEEEGDVQRSSAGGREAAFDAGAAFEATLQRRAGAGRPLDPAVQRDMEASFGAGFGGVRVHDDAEAVDLNRSVGANAFTRGQDIYLGSSHLDAGSAQGRHLLAHELTHVVQQTGGRAGRTVQRDNIKRGDELPDLKKTTEGKIGKALDRDAGFNTVVGAEQLRQLLKAVQTTASLRSALGTASASFTDAMLTDVRAAYLAPLGGAIASLRQMAKSARGGTMSGDATNLVMSLESDVNRALKSKYTGQALEDRKQVVIALRVVGQDRYGTGQQVFDTARGGTKLEPAYLSDGDKKAFAAALKLLPIIRSLTDPGGAATGAAIAAQGGQAGQAAKGATPQGPEWRNGGKLTDTVIVKQSKGLPSWLSKRREAKQLQKFKAKIQAADDWVRSLVEPEILRRVPRPDIVMHTRGRMKVLGSAKRFVFLPDATGFRPNFSGKEVNLAYNEVFELITHELGHAIEGFLPIQSWHDMNLLLERRHEEKMEREGTPGSRAARTGATMWTSGAVNFGPLTNEGRYAGTYVTGKYTTTAYDDGGNAEVFSQALEFLSKPSDALRLIDGDPQHAAIVLRAIRPAEYRAIKALELFDQFLPKKG